MRLGRNLRTLFAGLAALAGVAGAGAVGVLAGDATADRWVADPDDQYLLDVSIRQTRLGEGVRAYATPEGGCVVLGDFLTALDVPMKIDLEARRASGWAFREKQVVEVDRTTGRVRFGTQTEALPATAVRDTPEGWCVDSAALGRWFGITVTPRLNGSSLLLESEAKLPAEMAAERRKRAAAIKHDAGLQLSSLPQVRVPYRMWRAPALDFVVSGGVTYRASSGTEIDRRAAVYAAGEVAHLSYNASFTTDDQGMPQSVRLRAFRADPDGGLLGPLGATLFEFGDVASYNSRLLGSGAMGRGVAVTNRPLNAPLAFDRTRFEGDLPVGWEAELYRNGQLLGFSSGDNGSRYQFDDVQLLYGENKIDIILYGPQGQIRTRTEMVNVGQDNVPPGETWYYVGANQPGRDLVNFHPPPDSRDLAKGQATLSVAHGIDQRTSVAVTVQAVQLADERLTYVEGAVRRSFGAALVEVSAARDNHGGTAARAQLLTRIGEASLSAEALLARDFRLSGAEQRTVRQGRVAIDAPLKLGRTTVPVHGDVRYEERKDGSRQLEAAARLSAHVDRFNLSTDLRYRRNWTRDSSTDPASELQASLIGSGRIGGVRVRGQTSWDIVPTGRFRTAEVSAYWSASEKADFEAAVSYDATQKLARGRLTHVRRLQTMALAVTGEAATDGSVAVGFNLNFSMDSGRGFNLMRQTLANSGAVRANVYRDLNDNGRRDAGEPFEKGALITTGPRLAERTTDAQGNVLVAGLTNYLPVAVGIDATSLADPTLAPRKALQVVVPRPGVAADVEIGLVGAGDIEGAVVRDGGEGFEGLDLELVGEDGKVLQVTRSDFDGFFLFQRVAYGRYTIRIAADSARTARVLPTLDLSATISSDQPVARLGAVRVRAMPTMAANVSTEEATTGLRP